MEDKNPVNLNGRTDLHVLARAENNFHSDVCSLILEKIDDRKKLLIDDNGDTPIHSAANVGNFKICQMIIESLENKNPTINANRVTLLHLMVKDNLLEPTKLIIDRISDLSPRDIDGSTPLHYAAQYENFDACKLFIARLEDKNPKDDYGDTPLHTAAVYGHLSICKLIMANISDKYPKNQIGATPLHDAAEHGHLEICKLMAKDMADIHAKDNNGKTPYDMAKENDHASIMHFLKHSFLSIPESDMTRPHLPPGFWAMEE